AMFDTVKLNVIIPPDSIVSHTLDFACLGCHTTRDVTWASNYATNMHNRVIVITSVESEKHIPSAYYLKQNYPNPFNSTTQISFGLPSADNVSIVIYNTTGRIVRRLVSGYFEAGHYTVSWDGTDDNGNLVSSGVYLYRLETNHYIDSKKMTLIK
ncbi:MAG: FlgD immunoglobulin-like domain containing protein, partial [Candidatus Kryptonium sp.]